MVHMKGLVIPTYAGHFDKNILFLKSMIKNVNDIENIIIRFVTSNDEESQSLKAETDKLKINVDIISIVEILSQINIPKQESENLLSICGKLGARQAKYSYQAIKKIYGTRHLDAEETLILDSECLVIKPTSISYLFDNYFKNPFVFITSQFSNEYSSPGGNRFNQQSLKVIDKDLSNKDLVNKWVWEYQGWFIKKHILDDFFNFAENHHGCSMYEILKNNRNIWEIVSYWWFIYLNNEKYKEYRFLDGKKEIKKLFSDNLLFEKYIKKYHLKGHGIIEHLLLGLEEDNYDDLTGFISNFSLNLIRFEEWHANGNIYLQKQLVDQCDSVKLVVCSESAYKYWKF